MTPARLPRANPCLPCMVAGNPSESDEAPLVGVGDIVKARRSSRGGWVRGVVDGLFEVIRVASNGDLMVKPLGDKNSDRAILADKSAVVLVSRGNPYETEATREDLEGENRAYALGQKCGLKKGETPERAAYSRFPEANQEDERQAFLSGLRRENPDRRRARPTDLPIKKIVTETKTRTERVPEERSNPKLMAGQNPSFAAMRIRIEKDLDYAHRIARTLFSEEEIGTAPDQIREAALIAAQALDRNKKKNNPKLMVLNPHSVESLIAQAEKTLRRRLTTKERSNAMQAIKEFRTFHGRLPESLSPVDAPPGTPLFLNYVGHELRRDYAVKINSERRGNWTHKAGDHGGKKHTAQAIIASVPGRKKHNTVTVEPRGAKTYFKPTHGLMG